MNSTRRCTSNPLPVLRWAALAAAMVVMPAMAQYKVVGPDGKVTYTDRVPGASDGKVTALGGRTGAAPVDAALPLELRQAVGRYPVTLYVTATSCEPCDTGRQLLRARGIPYSEKQIVAPEDSEALERLSGGRDVPTLTIGAQTLRGLSPDVWNNYLDGAGYPRDSRLPKNFQYAAATPITERRDATPQRAAAPAARPSAVPVEPRQPAPETNIKF